MKIEFGGQLLSEKSNLAGTIFNLGLVTNRILISFFWFLLEFEFWWIELSKKNLVEFGWDNIQCVKREDW